MQISQEYQLIHKFFTGTMNNKIKLSKYILFISVFTFISILTFVVQSGYAGLMKTDSSDQKDKIDTTPIDTKLDLGIIENIKKTQEYTNHDLLVIPTQSPDTSATQSALVNE